MEQVIRNSCKNPITIAQMKKNKWDNKSFSSIFSQVPTYATKFVVCQLKNFEHLVFHLKTWVKQNSKVSNTSRKINRTWTNLDWWRKLGVWFWVWDKQQFGFLLIKLKFVCCHPILNVGNASLDTDCGACYVFLRCGCIQLHVICKSLLAVSLSVWKLVQITV